MKTRTLRILSWLLALLMITSSLVACDTESESYSDEPDLTNAFSDLESPSETETEIQDFMPDIEKKDYGEAFNMLIMSASNMTKYHWIKEGEGDAMTEALFARQEKVREHLGVELIGTEANTDHTVYTEPFKTAIKNKDNSIQLMLSHVHSGVTSLIQSNYLRDYTTVDQFDLDADYWNREFMEGLSVDNHMYLGRNDFNILYTYVISYNKEMMEKYQDTLESDVYTLVDNYKWTLNQMMSLASQVYIDATSDGKSADDTFGITGVQWVPYIGFLHASGIQYISINEAGNYEVSVYNELYQAKTAALIEKLSELAAADYAWFRYKIEPTPLVEMHTGRTLMQLTNTYDLPTYCNFDVEFGILPYPMFDEAQKDIGYRHLQWGGYLCMPSYTANLEMCAETLEMLAFFSEDVNVTFYEKLLGKQVADAPLDSKMLDLVWNTLWPEFAQAYDDVSGGWLYMIPELTHVGATVQLASYVKSKETSSNKAIGKFLTLVQKMNEKSGS